MWVMFLASKWGEGQTLACLNTDFLIAEVTGRILGPRIAGQLQRPNAGIAAADLFEPAVPAAPFQRAGAGAQPGQHRIIARPEFGERLCFDIADRIVRPVGVRMHIAQCVDIGNTETGGIAAPGFQDGS